MQGFLSRKARHGWRNARKALIINYFFVSFVQNFVLLVVKAHDMISTKAISKNGS